MTTLIVFNSITKWLILYHSVQSHVLGLRVVAGADPVDLDQHLSSLSTGPPTVICHLVHFLHMVILVVRQRLTNIAK